MATNDDNQSNDKDLEIPKPKPDVEIGVVRSMPFASRFEDAWEVLKMDGITIEKLIAMRKTDGQAAALYGLMTLPILAALEGATFIQEKNIDGGEDEAKFIETMFTLPRSGGGMETSFTSFMEQMLLAVAYGFSVFEIVYDTPKSGPLKGKWTIKDLAYRSPDTCSFLVDDNGRYNGVRQRAMFQGKTIDVRLSKEHTVYYAANEAENPMYGRSFFAAAFEHWDKKVKLEYIMHLAAQRAAVGTRVGKAAPTATKEERADFKRALANLGVAQHILLPKDYEVVSLAEGGQFDFLGLVNYHNSQMSKSVLAPFFDQNQGGGQNDGALVDFGKQSDALFLLQLKTIMRNIESVINNKIIPRFIDWNFSSGKYPEFHFGELTPEQKSAVQDTFEKMMTGNTTPQFNLALEEKYSDQLGLNIDYGPIREDALEKAKQDKVMQDAQYQQGLMGAALGGDPATSQTLDQANGVAGMNPSLPNNGAAPPPTPDQGGPIPGAGGAPAPTGDPSASMVDQDAPQPLPGGGPGGSSSPNPDEPATGSTLSLGSIPKSYLPPGFDLTGSLTGDDGGDS